MACDMGAFGSLVFVASSPPAPRLLPPLKPGIFLGWFRGVSSREPLLGEEEEEGPAYAFYPAVANVGHGNTGDPL